MFYPIATKFGISMWSAIPAATIAGVAYNSIIRRKSISSVVEDLKKPLSMRFLQTPDYKITYKHALRISDYQRCVLACGLFYLTHGLIESHKGNSAFLEAKDVWIRLATAFVFAGCLQIRLLAHLIIAALIVGSYYQLFTNIVTLAHTELALSVCIEVFIVIVYTKCMRISFKPHNGKF